MVTSTGGFCDFANTVVRHMHVAAAAISTVRRTEGDDGIINVEFCRNPFGEKAASQTHRKYLFSIYQHVGGHRGGVGLQAVPGTRSRTQVSTRARAHPFQDTQVERESVCVERESNRAISRRMRDGQASSAVAIGST